MHSLEEYGFDGCSIETTNGTVDIRNIPSLSTIRTLQFMDGQLSVDHPLNNGITPSYEIGSILAEGTYGRVYHARRATRSTHARNIVIKESSSATLEEPMLHAIAHKTFADIGLGSVIPEFYEVTKQSSSLFMAMEWIQGSTLLKFFHVYLTKITNAAKVIFLPDSLQASRTRNDTLLLDVLVQSSIYLTILQKKLRFNHRDMKLNNLLIRHTSSRSRSILRKLDHPLLPTPWNCLYDLVMIDFGFACIACDSKKSMLEAGTFFKPDYDCMNAGRDLALLIYSIHAYFPLDQYVSPSLWTFLHQCMIAHKGDKHIQLLHGIQTDGTPCGTSHTPVPFDAGIYLFLRETDVEIPGCIPSVFLKGIAEEFVV